MGRWIAIGSKPAWMEFAAFRSALQDTGTWRVDARTSVTTVMMLADGRSLAECHAPTKEDVEQWLRQQQWDVESVTRIEHVAKTGGVWKAGQ